MDKDHFNKNREGYFGWFGYGGSIMQWHPELKIGFAFVIFEKFNNITYSKEEKNSNFLFLIGTNFFECHRAIQ